MYLCLDLSSKCTGYAKFSKDGKLIKKGRITPTKDIHPYLKIHFIVEQVKTLFAGNNELIIEGLYLGHFNGKRNVTTLIYLARLSGAVIYAWIVHKYKIPHIYKASGARALIGINGRANKAEVQLEILKRYKFTSVIKIKQYEKDINELVDKYKNKELKKGQFKYRMGKISNLIDIETGIGEDISDSIVLGLAYHKKIGEEN